MIALLDLLGALVFLAVMLALVTQVVIPMIFGTPLFPILRTDAVLTKTVTDAERKLEEATEMALLNEKLAEINRRKAQLEKINADN